MQPETCKIFAQLCESITEASTAMSLITDHPGGRQVVKSLHKSMGLAHDIDFQPIPKISWSDLKDSYKGAWVIMQCSNGTAAIKASGGTTGSYEVVTSDGGEVKTKTDSRGGNVLDFIKAEAGKPIKFFAAKNTSKVSDLKKQRADRQKGMQSGKIDQKAIIKKFRPLWVKAMTAALADVKGHVANMIKNDAFEKAKRKLDHIGNLQGNLEALETGTADESPGIISQAVNTAVLMAASHYYPEETGQITRGYGGSYSAERGEGPSKLLQDLSNGDTSKLGTILAFFKRALISG